MFLVLLTVFSCGKESKESVAEFHSITPVQSSVTMDDDGNATVEFMVDEPGYSFNYNVGSLDCAVSLRRQDGSESDIFRITGISPTESEGTYSVTIADLGVSGDCEEAAAGHDGIFQAVHNQEQ